MIQRITEEGDPSVERAQGRSDNEAARAIAIHAVRNLVPDKGHALLRSQDHPKRQAEEKHGSAAPTEDAVGRVEMLVDHDVVYRPTTQLAGHLINEGV